MGPVHGEHPSTSLQHANRAHPQTVSSSNGVFSIPASLECCLEWELQVDGIISFRVMDFFFAVVVGSDREHNLHCCIMMTFVVGKSMD